jgi:lysozyme
MPETGQGTVAVSGAKIIKRLTAFLAIFIAGALVLSWAVYPFVETAAFYHDVRGVDVSHHQGPIDWDRLKADGVEFAYIKASEGETFNDPRFSRNWFAAEQAGILRGAYHFFSPCRTGKAQAENFIRIVPADANALPAALDAEQMHPCRDHPTLPDLAAEIAVFLDTVEKATGKRPVIYTTREFHDLHLAGKFGKERFWVRSLVISPRFREENWIFWQYHNRGRRSGVDGPVDLNAYRGSLEELKALAAPR